MHTHSLIVIDFASCSIWLSNPQGNGLLACAFLYLSLYISDTGLIQHEKTIPWTSMDYPGMSLSESLALTLAIF